MRGRRILAVVGLLVLGAVLGAAIVLIVPGPVVPLQDAAVPGVRPADVLVALRDEPHPHIEVAPPDGSADVLFVLYPGAFLRPQAYTWIGVALAPHGVRTLIPAMPLDLAVLGPGRAEALVAAHPDARRVFVGGHSLGGAMAARYAAGRPDSLAGVVLLGAYAPRRGDLADTGLEVLVLAADQDSLATPDDVRGGMSRLPNDALLHVIPGAVHAFFGRYGPQRFDGTPTISRGEAEAVIVERLRSFLLEAGAP